MSESRLLIGLPAAPGVVVGPVVVAGRGTVPVVPAPVPPERVQDEIERFRAAVRGAVQELTALREAAQARLGAPYAAILDAQVTLAQDPSLAEETVRRIRLGRVSAAWALKEAAGSFARRLREIPDAFFQERGTDLDDVHRRLQRWLSLRPVPTASAGGSDPARGMVVAARSLGAAELLALPPGSAAGLILETGGPASHTAILAQALGLPAVMGVRGVLKVAVSGDETLVDGDRGRVILRPSARARRAAEARRGRWRERLSALERTASTDPVYQDDGRPVWLRANVEIEGQLDELAKFGAQGIGLLRSEYLVGPGQHPRPLAAAAAEEAYLAVYQRALRAAHPWPVVARISEAPLPLQDRPTATPMGPRGVRAVLRTPGAYRPQLRALLRAGVEGDLRVMLPLVTSPEEVAGFRRLLAAEAETLRREGIRGRQDLPVGVLVETPAAALCAEALAQTSDFVSVGTNDLVRYTLAVDRDDETAAQYFQRWHPAVEQLLRHVAASAARAGVPAAVCGEMAADPALAQRLAAMGFRELSMRPRALPAVRARLEREIPAGMSSPGSGPP